MKLSRKEFLRATALAGMAVPLAGCERISTEIAHRVGQEIPDSLALRPTKEVDPTFHLLSRAGFGPAPGELQRAQKMGANDWLKEQLDPGSIDDGLCAWRTHRFETIQLDPGTCYEYKKPVLRDEMVRHAVLAATYSKRQLFESMVEFWTDHLNIYIDKGDCMYLKPSDDRLVVRAHALGKFKDMIHASAVSPAMLVYLDGNENRKEGPRGIPNENYARELLELHTLGVHGGYTQNDVYETGRCLTGWRLHTPWQRAKVYFDSEHHDDGEKHVLGQTIPAGGGEKDLDRVLNIVCSHPSTALHIATKLCQRFVCEEPSTLLVKQIAATFTASGGDIKSTMKALLTSEQFRESRGAKVKRPFRFIVSSLRLLGADTFAHASVLEYLTRMGHAPYQYPTPDGYSDESQHWANSLLWRWNFALALASNKLEGITIALTEIARALDVGSASASVATNERKDKECASTFFAYLNGRMPNVHETEIFNKFAKESTAVGDAKQLELLGLIMSSPAFQKY